MKHHHGPEHYVHQKRSLEIQLEAVEGVSVRSSAMTLIRRVWIISTCVCLDISRLGVYLMGSRSMGLSLAFREIDFVVCHLIMGGLRQRRGYCVYISDILSRNSTRIIIIFEKWDISHLRGQCRSGKKASIRPYLT